MGAGGSPGRSTYLDNLKVVLIAGIIAIHAVLGYAGTIEAWNYSAFREVTLRPVTEVVLFVFVGPFGFFLIALLFLVAGLLTPPSLERKGTRRFVVDRLLRLGIPYVVYVLLLQPTFTYALEHPLGDAPGSWTEEWLGAEHRLDSGPLWFVGVLLVFSLAYAAWSAWRGTPSFLPHVDITLPRLAAVAAVVAVWSFLTRLVYPYGSEAGFFDLNDWQWPACLAAFLLGAVAVGRGWLEEVPEGLARQCRTVTLLGAVLMGVVLYVVGSRDAVDDSMGGWHLAAAGFSVADAVLSVFGSVWLLRVAQRRLARPRPLGPALGRSAYAAFIIQTPVLLGFAGLLRPVDVPAEVKALTVAVASVVCCFALGWLATRVPGLRRVV